MSLLKLADETLLQVAQLLHAKRTGHTNSILQLALTCKRAQRVCDTIIWTKYTLVVRNSQEYHKGYLYAPANRYKCTEEEWNALWDKRIAHLLSKASVVRDLTIEDAPYSQYRVAQTGTPDSLAFAQDLMDAAMHAISACKGIHTLRLVSTSHESPRWPLQMWSLILEGFPRLHTLAIKADFTDIPRPEGSPKKLRLLEGRWGAGLVDGLLAHEMILPTHLKIDFAQHNFGTSPKDNRFTPLPELASHIQCLDVTAWDRSLPGPVFDVSGLQHAKIDIAIYFLCLTYKFQIPPAWRSVKPHIQSIVAGGLSSFNVVRDHDIFITRPSLVECPDYTPERQDHLCSDATDRREQELMTAYYAARSPSQFR